MSMYCELSNSRLGLLYVAAMVLGADLILLCWRFLMDSLAGYLRLGGAQCFVPRSVFCSQQRNERVRYKGVRLGEEIKKGVACLGIK